MFMIVDNNLCYDKLKIRTDLVYLYVYINNHGYQTHFKTQSRNN